MLPIALQNCFSCCGSMFSDRALPTQVEVHQKERTALYPVSSFTSFEALWVPHGPSPSGISSPENGAHSQISVLVRKLFSRCDRFDLLVSEVPKPLLQCASPRQPSVAWV